MLCSNTLHSTELARWIVPEFASAFGLRLPNDRNKSKQEQEQSKWMLFRCSLLLEPSLAGR